MITRSFVARVSVQTTECRWIFAQTLIELSQQKMKPILLRQTLRRSMNVQEPPPECLLSAVKPRDEQLLGLIYSRGVAGFWRADRSDRPLFDSKTIWALPWQT